MTSDSQSPAAASASVEQSQESTSLFSSIASFFIPTAHAEAPEKDEEESGEEKEEPEEEEEEEEEPEDPAPAIREDCEQNVCGEHLHHFQHCQSKVEGGKGFPGEDCVEEFFHLLHCVDSCAAPKIFKKLA